MALITDTNGMYLSRARSFAVSSFFKASNVSSSGSSKPMAFRRSGNSFRCSSSARMMYLVNCFLFSFFSFPRGLSSNSVH